MLLLSTCANLLKRCLVFGQTTIGGWSCTLLTIMVLGAVYIGKICEKEQLKLNLFMLLASNSLIHIQEL